jgi:hypothetical protein
MKRSLHGLNWIVGNGVVGEEVVTKYWPLLATQRWTCTLE